MTNTGNVTLNALTLTDEILAWSDAPVKARCCLRCERDLHGHLHDLEDRRAGRLHLRHDDRPGHRTERRQDHRDRVDHRERREEPRELGANPAPANTGFNPAPTNMGTVNTSTVKTNSVNTNTVNTNTAKAEAVNGAQKQGQGQGQGGAKPGNLAQKSATVVGSSDNHYSAPGQTIDYSYLITNTGNVPRSR